MLPGLGLPIRESDLTAPLAALAWRAFRARLKHAVMSFVPDTVVCVDASGRSCMLFASRKTRCAKRSPEVLGNGNLFSIRTVSPAPKRRSRPT